MIWRCLSAGTFVRDAFHAPPLFSNPKIHCRPAFIRFVFVRVASAGGAGASVATGDATQGESKGATEDGAASAKDPETEPDTLAGAPDEGPKRVEEDPDAPRVFKIMSDPEGADVTRGGEKVGTTPMTVEVAADADPSIYRIQLEGYEPEAVQVDPGSARRTLVVALTKDVDGGKSSGKTRSGGGKKKPRGGKTRKPEKKTDDPASKPPEEKPKTPSIDLLDDDDTTKVKRLD